jgi:hypothetical protein
MSALRRVTWQDKEGEHTEDVTELEFSALLDRDAVGEIYYVCNWGPADNSEYDDEAFSYGDLRGLDR